MDFLIFLKKVIPDPSSGQEPKKSVVNRKTLLAEQSPTKGDKQNFFIDIRTNQPPPQPPVLLELPP